MQRIILIQMIALITLAATANSMHRLGSSAISRLLPDTEKITVGVSEEPGRVQSSNIRLDATYGKNFFDLIWSTQSDKGFDHVEIERSYDGIHYEKLGEVKGTGPCSRKDNFFFRDKVRPALYRTNDFYYRLKQVETDGSSSYSKTLITRMYNSKSLSAISITPDASLNDILVNVQLKENSFVVMKVADKAGNEIIRKALHGDVGFNIYKLDGTSSLQPGLYSLEVIVNSNERMQMKLEKN